MNRAKVRKLKKYLKKRLSTKQIVFLRNLALFISRIKRCFVYSQYDYEAYWRRRAYGSGQSRVLWTNEEYNQLVRELERDIIKPYVAHLRPGDQVLDIGCGIGVVAKMMLDINPRIQIDAVDFPEMIEVAKKENADPRIQYIASAAESYFNGHKKYRFILSSGCFSAIRDVEKMERGMDNCVRMLGPSGVILLIDPFHKWNYLARAKCSSRQVIRFMRARGCILIEKSGVLFWPYREWLCNSNVYGEELRRRFFQGERLLEILGKHAWADYKVLAFRKISEHGSKRG